MTSPIHHKDDHIWLSNRHFDNLVDFALETAERGPLTPAERLEVDRIRDMDEQGALWPGRGFDIVEDFPGSGARKLWARLFLDTARAILDGEVGSKDHVHWRCTYIYQSYAAGLLFEKAVREEEPTWFADSRDRREAQSSQAEGSS